MSITGTVMILVTLLTRSLFNRVLPKRMFSILWWVTTVRFLIPYSLPCEFSVYSLLDRKRIVPETTGNVTALSISNHLAEYYSAAPSKVQGVPGASLKPDAVTVATEIWLVGVLTLTAIFVISYIRCIRKFRESLPVENEFINRWICRHKILRIISVRYTDKISSPLTYGTFRPTILLPKNFEKIDHDDLEFVLAHEYTHIRRFDTLFKLVLTAVLCVHWFNPAVWLMYFLANRDIEYSCDEGVMCMLGGNRFQDYAMALVHMEEARNGFAPLVNSFGKNPIKERVVCILKFKKITAPAIVAAACLIAATTTVFATTAAEPKSDDNVIQLGKYGEVISGGNSIDETSSDDTSSAVSTESDPENKQETSDKNISSDDGGESKFFWHNTELLPPGGALVYSFKDGVAIMSYVPTIGHDFEPIRDTFKPEGILTFDSRDDILHINTGDYATSLIYHEDGSVTVYYFNFEDEPLDFSEAVIEIKDVLNSDYVKPDHEVHFREESIT